MEKLEIKISFSYQEVLEMRSRYHFGGTQMGTVFLEVFRAVSAAVDCTAFVGSKEEGAARLSFVEEEAFLAVIVTLGQGIDKLQEEWSLSGELLKAYAADCIGMEFLKKAYLKMAEGIKKEGTGIRRYHFLGDKYPLERMADIFSYLSPRGISYNKAFALIPKKTAVYIGELGDGDCISLCDQCTNNGCPNRQRRDGRALSYGYQRIFGKKETAGSTG